MQRRSSKIPLTASSRNLLLFILVLCLGITHAAAQDNQTKYVGYLKSIKSVMEYSDLAYRYRVTLINEATKRVSDETEGILLKHGKAYLDSNKRFFTVSGNGYFLKANLQEKVANVYKLSTLAKNTGMKTQDMSSPIMTVPDSMLLKVGKFTGIAETDILQFRYTFNSRSEPVRDIAFKLRKKDMAVIDITITTNEAGNYSRTIHLFDFDNIFDSQRINPSLYFKVSGTSVTMLNKLHSFKVNALL